MAFMNEWIRPSEKVLSAEQVRRLDPGMIVTIVGADRYGECYREEATIVQSGKKKLLCTVDRGTWEKRYQPIKEKESRRFTVKKRN